MQTGPRAFLLALASIAFVNLIGCGGGAPTIPTAPVVHGEWTWVSGSNSVNQLGNYGTQGVASPGNAPGARVYPVSGTDNSGNFWLFGGFGDAASSGRDLNDLWKYSNGEWTWVSGSNQPEQAGIYGTKGVPAPSNVPGARLQAVSWIDPQGNFWLFGGLGIDSTGTRGELNDLWRYSGGQWTWMAGSSVTEQPGIYGTKGIPAPGNTPGTRVVASSWTDTSGNLWLFGGNGRDSNGNLGELNDLWKFNSGEWTWMTGSNLNSQLGTYGIQGTANPNNAPGARINAVTWTDTSGNLWLFGGDGHDATNTAEGCATAPYICYLNDLWKYSAGEWTWMGGSNVVNAPGTYGTQGAPSAANFPGARWGGVTWVDSSGNVWLFGGNGFDSAPGATFEFGGLNDLWKYSGGQWTWMGGSNITDQPGTYGTQGVPASGNVPGQRYAGVGWADTSGNLWLFGGGIFLSGGGDFNDLWEFQP